MILNGYNDGSGKGTITFNNEPLLRTHWGCSCCDYFNDEDMESDEMKLAIFITKILNEHEKEIKRFLKKELNLSDEVKE